MYFDKRPVHCSPTYNRHNQLHCKQGVQDCLCNFKATHHHKRRMDSATSTACLWGRLVNYVGPRGRVPLSTVLKIISNCRNSTTQRIRTKLHVYASVSAMYVKLVRVSMSCPSRKYITVSHTFSVTCKPVQQDSAQRCSFVLRCVYQLIHALIFATRFHNWRIIWATQKKSYHAVQRIQQSPVFNFTTHVWEQRSIYNINLPWHKKIIQ